MSTRPPNIVLTIADDQRGTALGCAGIEPVLTPALDRLAARGTRFAQAQHFGSCHDAICSPSRAMLHTGQAYFGLDESLLGLTHPPADAAGKIPLTLGQRLRGAGYRAFATGKWHNGTHSFQPSFDEATNIFFGGMNDHWFTPVQDFDPTGRYPAERRRPAAGFSTEVFAQSAIDFIRSRRGNDQPFFCYCAFTAPHDPRTPPDAWRRRYEPRTMPLFPNIPPGPEVSPVTDPGCLNVRDERLLGQPRDASELRRTLAEYYAMISHMDEWIGKIHDALDEIGAAENTLVIHTADHGLAVGQHGLLGKQNLYQHSLQVPLILAGPGITPSVSFQLCYQHDLHPTLLAAAGLPSDGSFQNLHGSERTVISAAFRQNLRSIRNHRYKLILDRNPASLKKELFDLEHDPWETANLAEKPELHPLIAEFETALQAWENQHTGPV